MWSAVESSLNLDDAFLDNELDPRHGMTTWANWHETKDYNHTLQTPQSSTRLSSRVDDLQLVGSQQDVEKPLDNFRKQEWTLQVQGPCSPKVAGQCAFLKRHFASDGSGSMTVRMDQKYVKKLVDLLDLRVNKGTLTPTTGTFQKGLQGQPLSREESSLYRTCVGILLYTSTERPDCLLYTSPSPRDA